jgi:hypothetical protein
MSLRLLSKVSVFSTLIGASVAACVGASVGAAVAGASVACGPDGAAGVAAGEPQAVRSKSAREITIDRVLRFEWDISSSSGKWFGISKDDY